MLNSSAFKRFMNHVKPTTIFMPDLTHALNKLNMLNMDLYNGCYTRCYGSRCHNQLQKVDFNSDTSLSADAKTECCVSMSMLAMHL